MQKHAENQPWRQSENLMFLFLIWKKQQQKRQNEFNWSYYDFWTYLICPSVRLHCNEESYGKTSQSS